LVEEVQPYLKKEHLILDIGSGFGSFVYLLREKCYRAYGIEISDFLVRYARQRIQKLNTSFEISSDIYLMDTALQLPFQDSYFDVITMWNVLEHIEDYKIALHEAIRVLKPGGKLFIKNVNYASCFIEPHYRVFWLSFLPKKIATYYLKLRGRNPEYIQNGIFYVSNFSIIKILQELNMDISNDRIQKLSAATPRIVSRFKRYVWKIATVLHLKSFVRLILKASIMNPFCSYINILAIKK
jgi:ubiquinone/menaquinone biosynthesis C-methylase UbiE